MSFRVDPKRTFFDRPTVLNAIGRARAKSLSKFGAYVRRAARSSIRKSKNASKAGKPPRSHVGTLKRLIYFGFDASTASVVIGPTPFAAGTIPRVLELGGATTRRNPRRRNRKIGDIGEVRIHGNAPAYARMRTAAQVERSRKIQETLFGPYTVPAGDIEPRPFMGPAMRQVLPQLPTLFANSVR